MAGREDNARQMATKDGVDFDALDEAMKNAYLHNADVEMDRPHEPTGEESKGRASTGLLYSLVGKRTSTPIDVLWERVKRMGAAKMTFPHIVSMSCGKQVVFDDAEHIQGLGIEDIKCRCGDPTHFIVKFEDRREEIPVGKVVRAEKREGGIDVVAELSAEGAARLKDVGIIEEGESLSEVWEEATAMADGFLPKLQEEVKDDRRESVLPDQSTKELPIGKEYKETIPADLEVKVKEVTDGDSNSGTGQPDTPAGSSDTGKPKQSKKPKAKRKARKRAKKVL